MKNRKTRPDHEALYQVAESQAGYFTAKQARRYGFSYSLLHYYERQRIFLRMARGVYRLSRFPASRFEDLFVAWLLCGPKSIVSHESALAVHELSDALPSEIHITIPRSGSRRRKGIHIHTQQIKPCEIIKRHGLPVTSVPRTLMDVAKSGLSDDQIAQAIREALQRGLTTKQELRKHAQNRSKKMQHFIDKIILTLEN